MYVYDVGIDITVKKSITCSVSSRIQNLYYCIILSVLYYNLAYLYSVLNLQGLNKSNHEQKYAMHARN